MLLRSIRADIQSLYNILLLLNPVGNTVLVLLWGSASLIFHYKGYIIERSNAGVVGKENLQIFGV